LLRLLANLIELSAGDTQKLPPIGAFGQDYTGKIAPGASSSMLPDARS
jgi:hypothetical protein